MHKLIPALLLSISGLTVGYATPGDDDSSGPDDQDGGPTFKAPEIDPAAAGGALTLLLGGMLVLRGGIGKKLPTER